MLVAAELAMAAPPPSGRVSVERVLNVLARLNAANRPANVLTPPQANTAPYDRLRRHEAEEAGHA